jgi:hypothetical protein
VAVAAADLENLFGFERDHIVAAQGGEQSSLDVLHREQVSGIEPRVGFGRGPPALVGLANALFFQPFRLVGLHG